MSVVKDYYKILNVNPASTNVEIKKAYRKLVMKYHPDRNPNDELSSTIFTELAEAYNVLSDVEARKKYNNERYLTAEQEYKKPAESIETLILRINKINNYVKIADPFRFNKDALLYSIKQLFPDDLNLLLKTNKQLLIEFLEKISDPAKNLSSQQTKQLMLLLDPLYAEHAWLKQKLNDFMQRQLKEEQWEKYKIVLAVVLAVIICIIIFFTARN